MDKAEFRVSATICSLSAILVLTSIVGYLAGIFSDLVAFLVFLSGIVYLLLMALSQSDDDDSNTDSEARHG